MQKINILGIGVSAINLEQAVAQIDSWLQSRQPNYVCVTPVHGIMECQYDATLKGIYNAAGLVTPDGMPLVWLGRLLGYPHVRRVYGPDLMLAVCEHSLGPGYRHYFYGGAPGVAERLGANLQKRFPGLQVAGYFSPPYRPLTAQEDEEVIQMINTTEPDIVWVGLGAPKQEIWMAEHLGRLSAPVLIGVGAAFDFHTGLKPQAPRWMQRSGLEWFFRLLTEPRRLWRRYLVYNPLFVAKILLQLSGIHRYPLEADATAVNLNAHD